VRLVISDAHTGLIEAIAANLPGAVWQRCRTHYAANLMSVIPKAMWLAVKAMLHSVYDQPDADSVHAQFDRLLDYVDDKLPDAFEHLGAVLAEQTDEWAEGRRYLGLDILAKSRHTLIADTDIEEVTDTTLELSA